MNSLSKILLSSGVLGLIVGCSPVKYTKDDSASCAGTNTCLVDPLTNTADFTINYTKTGGKVDIIFVNDNSASMSFEQNQMAQRFGSFIQQLNNRAIDFRIGMITTDVSSGDNPARAINQNGALQDGRLVKFTSGSSDSGVLFLTPSTANLQVRFSNTISRPETRSCEQFLAANPSPAKSVYDVNCPSGDERGLLAVNKFLTEAADSKGERANSILRPDAHLAIIVLSDEDVRSGLYYDSSSFLGYQLSTDDLPQTVLSNVQRLYPQKTVSAHSIVVMPGTLSSNATGSTDAARARFAADQISGAVTSANRLDLNRVAPRFFNGFDQACQNIQNSQTNGVRGSAGYVYSLLSDMTGGIVGDICASDYGSQLIDIGTNIGERMNEVALPCSEPLSLSVSPNSYSYQIVGNVLKFNQDLAPGTQIQIKGVCKTK